MNYSPNKVSIVMVHWAMNPLRSAIMRESIRTLLETAPDTEIVVVDNGGDVLYELSKNPGKMGSILSLPQNLAVKAIKELSSSIKMNQSASRSNEPAPLSHTKPSYSGLAAGREGSKSGNGPETHTIADLKALKARYRS